MAISEAQPFMSGSKRTGYIAMAQFLDQNGLELRAEQAPDQTWLDVAKRIGDAEAAPDRDAAITELIAWVRDRSGPKAPDQR